MKKYIKPEMEKMNISVAAEIATNLSNWLQANGLNEYNDSITTFMFNS